MAGKFEDTAIAKAHYAERKAITQRLLDDADPQELAERLLAHADVLDYESATKPVMILAKSVVECIADMAAAQALLLKTLPSASVLPFKRR